LCSLMDFRRVNRYARAIVNGMPEFKAITTHACDALHQIFRIQAGRNTSCGRLYNKLCTAECHRCGRFAVYLYLVTCERVCRQCYVRSTHYGRISRCDAELVGLSLERYGISEETFRTLPSMKAPLLIMGDCPMHKLCCYGCAAVVESRTLIDWNSFLRAGDGSLWEEWVSPTRTRRQKLLALLELFCFENDLALGPNFQPLARVPWFNRISRELEYGVLCPGCEERPLWKHAKYTVAGLREHIAKFGEIQVRVESDGKVIRWHKGLTSLRFSL
jgi:hypothetical protein